MNNSTENKTNNNNIEFNFDNEENSTLDKIEIKDTIANDKATIEISEKDCVELDNNNNIVIKKDSGAEDIILGLEQLYIKNTDS
jgi:hypothetical protein